MGISGIKGLHWYIHTVKTPVIKRSYKGKLYVPYIIFLIEEKCG